MNRPPAPAVRLARPDEWRRIGALLGEAFQDDPVWAWVCSDEQRRQRHLGAVFAQIVKGRVAKGWGWTAEAGDGAAVWAAPGHWKARPTEVLGMALPLLRAVGTRDVRRKLGALSTMERHHPREPHWYLEIIGTDPSLRGRGVGSALLAPMIERCDAEHLPAYLESSKEENLAFYARFGFEVTDELRVASDAPPLWPMWREPR